MARIDGGEVLVRALRGFDVRTIFTLHGGHLDSALHAAAGAGIRLIDTRHEQAAGIAAMGWAHTTGQVGVVMTTAGGGVTNLATALANAFADAVPMVFLGGAPPLRDHDALAVNSGFDQLSIMGGVTKWAHRVTHPEMLPEAVARAFQTARAGRPGPVYLDLPADVLFARIEEDALSFTDGSVTVAAPAPAPRAVARALELLRTAERPVVLAGGGVVRSGASAELRAFAERTGIPVLTNNKSRGVLPTDHPLWGRGFSALAAIAARGRGEADVVLVLGARFGIYTGGRRTSVVPAAATVIQVDVHAEEIGRLRNVDLGITADSKEMLSALLADTGPWPDRTTWASTLTGRDRAPALTITEAGTGTITPARLAAEVAAAVTPDALLVADGGETPAWFDAAATSTGPGRWFGHGYVGVMGEGLPLAIGAQVAHPDQQVVALVGDGAVGFNFAEFDTMVRHGLPIVVVVNNDRQWGMSAHGQDLIWGPGHRVVSDLRETRYDLAAAGFGAHPEHVEKLEDLRPALDRALAAGRPACVNVTTDATDIAAVTRRFVGAAAEGPVSPDGRARIPLADVLEV
jgi:acetolactate synthase-1/2/3 large subunit